MAIIKVKTGGITADAITDALIADDVVGTEHLTANEVDTTALGADAVTGAQLADDAVNSEHYTDGSVDTAHIADAQITTAKLSTAVFTGATDIGADLADADLILVDDGAGGTIRKAALSRVKTYVGGGLPNADFWRLNADVKFGTSTQIIDSNWERVNSDNYGVIGTAMSESSGHFTFPATGIWLIQYNVSLFCDSGEVERFDNRIAMTTNNSSYDDAAFSHMSTDTTNYRQSTTLSFIFDCENTSTHKIRFNYYDVNNTNSTLVGAGNATCTGAFFLKLGDT